MEVAKKSAIWPLKLGTSSWMKLCFWQKWWLNLFVVVQALLHSWVLTLRPWSVRYLCILLARYQAFFWSWTFCYAYKSHFTFLIQCTLLIYLPEDFCAYIHYNESNFGNCCCLLMSFPSSSSLTASPLSSKSSSASLMFSHLHNTLRNSNER